MPDGTSFAPSDNLGFLVYRVHQSMRERCENQFAPFGVTPAEWGVIAHCRHGINTPAGLAECLGINRGAITRLLDSLEGAGLVARTPNPADGRSTLVLLTPHGESVSRQMAESAAEIHRAYVSGLSSGEQDELLRLLRLVIQTMPGQSHRGNECPGV